MKSHLVAGAFVAAIAVSGAGAVLAIGPQAGEPLPPGHPPLTPPGHPPVTTRPAVPPGHPPMNPDLAGARSEDVASVESVVASYYASISGAAGAARDWDRFQSLFVSEGVLVTIVGGRSGDAALTLTPERFATMNDRYFTASGYGERPIRNEVDQFGRIAHVRSTYESRRGDGEPYARGVNSFQLVRAAGRWSIVSVIWERERADLPLGPEHLPAGAASN